MAVDHPYQGAICPLEHYRKDFRVMTILVEINRRLYLDEATGNANNAFNSVTDKGATPRQWLRASGCAPAGFSQ